MIKLLNLTVGNGTTPLLLNQNIEICRPGTLTALIGRNGSGKSTLLRVLCGQQRPTHGEALIGDLDPAQASPMTLAKHIAVVTTETVRVRNLTCRELVAMGRTPYTGLLGNLSPTDERCVSEALDAVGMAEFAARQLTQISDGEMRRVMIARALAQDTPVMILDEPTSFLDVPGRYEVCRLLSNLAHRQNKTIVYSTHELEPAMRYADSIALLAEKRLLILPPEKMRANDQFKSLFEI